MAALEEALDREPLNGPFLYAMAALMALSGKSELALDYLARAEKLGVDGKVLRMWLSQKRQQETAQQRDHATAETTS